MKLTQTKEYAILFLRQVEEFTDVEISKRLKIPVEDVRRVLKENGDTKIDLSAPLPEDLEEEEEKPPIPEKTSNNSPKMKDLMMTRTQSGKEGVTAMTQDASSYSDSVKKTLENVRAERIQRNIYRPNQGSNE